jgi:hypothetical protein
LNIALFLARAWLTLLALVIVSVLICAIVMEPVAQAVLGAIVLMGLTTIAVKIVFAKQG